VKVTSTVRVKVEPGGAGDVLHLAGLAIVSTCDTRAPGASEAESRDEGAPPAPPWKESAERSEDRSVVVR
jgi:hypothetical protein